MYRVIQYNDIQASNFQIYNLKHYSFEIRVKYSFE